MFKNCYFCKKSVRISNNSIQSRSASTHKKNIRIVGIRFKETPLITNRRRFSNDQIPTRVICKTCKPKDKKQKPLDYLVKALSNTISEGYNIEADTDFCPEDFCSEFGHHDYLVDEELITETEEVVIFDDEENAYALMTEEETLFWGGAVHTLDNIAVQQGILRELFDSAPEDIVHQPELMRELFENVPEQLAERQRLMRGRDENIPELLADQQRLLRGAAEHIQEPVEDNQILLREGDIPQHLAVQRELDAGDGRPPELIEVLQIILPEGENNVVGQLVMQQRLRVDEDDLQDMNELQQRPEVGDVNLPEQRVFEERGNHVPEQLVNQQHIFRVAPDNVSKQVAIHLGVRIGNGKLPHSFAVHQKILPEDDSNVVDMFVVHRTLLQEDDDHVQESEDNLQEATVNQQAYVGEDDSDVLDLLTVWQGLKLDDTLPRLIPVQCKFSPAYENSVTHQGLRQDVENNVPATSQKNLQFSKDDDNNNVNNELAFDQELLQMSSMEQQESLQHTCGIGPNVTINQIDAQGGIQDLRPEHPNKLPNNLAYRQILLSKGDGDTLKSIDEQQKLFRGEDKKTLNLKRPKRLNKDNHTPQKNFARHQKLPPDHDYTINNNSIAYQDLQESTVVVPIPDQQVQLRNNNDVNDTLMAEQGTQKEDVDKAKELIANESGSLGQGDNNALEPPTVENEIQTIDNNLSELNAICQKPPDANLLNQLDARQISLHGGNKNLQKPIEDRHKYFLDGENNALKLEIQIKLNRDGTNITEKTEMHQKLQPNTDKSVTDYMIVQGSYDKQQKSMVEHQVSLLEENNNVSHQFAAQGVRGDAMQNDAHEKSVKQKPLPDVVGNIPQSEIKLLVDKDKQVSCLERMLRVDVASVSNENEIVDVFSGKITFLGKRVNEIEGESPKVRKMSLEDSITTRRVEESSM